MAQHHGSEASRALPESSEASRDEADAATARAVIAELARRISLSTSAAETEGLAVALGSAAARLRLACRFIANP